MIKRIKIRGFRSLDVDFDLTPLTVLIGRSGTGKSNFVDAMNFLGLLLSSQQGQWWSELARYNVVPAFPGEHDLLYQIVFGIGEDSDHFEYSLMVELSQNRYLKHERLTCNGRQILIHNLDQSALKQTKNSAVQNVYHNPRLGELAGSREAMLAFEFLTRNIGCYNFPSNVLSADANPVNNQKPWSSERDKGLAGDAGNFLRVFDDISTHLGRFHNVDEIVASLKFLNPTIDLVQLATPARNELIVTHRMDSEQVRFKVEQESEGFRRYLAHLLALYQLPPKQALLFEEPEKGIHPAALANLADEYRACAETGRGQVILTTHSPELLDHFSGDCIRVVELQNHITRISPVSANQLNALRQSLMRPGEMLTDELAASDAVLSGNAE
jgi:predicted ATPase